MAESFNLNSFLNEYKTYNNRQYTAVENGRRAMEERELERAQEAIQGTGFLGITLSEKLTELGVGKYVFEQIEDTARGLVTGVINPFTNWLKEYEDILDTQSYEQSLNEVGKQYFYTQRELNKSTTELGGQLVGQKLVIDS